MARVLVTGGAGYVGSVCCAELLRAGYSVTVVDDLSTGFRDAVPAAAELVELDVGDAPAMEDLARRNRFDAVFHFAAKALVAESVRDPGIFFASNVGAGIQMLEALRKAGIRKFVFSSSAAIYGTPSRVPIDEDSEKNPVNAYGLTKLMLEQALDWYARSYGWSVASFRYFNAAGATALHGERHQPETHLIPLLLEVAAGEREFFSLYGDDYDTPDGTCLRDFVHVADIANAHILAIGKSSESGMRCYNIGVGQAWSVRQVHREVEKITGRKVPLRVAERRPGDPAVLYASCEKIKQELGWKPGHASLPVIIQSAWEWKQKKMKSSLETASR